MDCDIYLERRSWLAWHSYTSVLNEEILRFEVHTHVCIVLFSVQRTNEMQKSTWFYPDNHANFSRLPPRAMHRCTSDSEIPPSFVASTLSRSRKSEQLNSMVSAPHRRPRSRRWHCLRHPRTPSHRGSIRTHRVVLAPPSPFPPPAATRYNWHFLLRQRPLRR